MKKFLLIYPTQITEAPITLAMLGAVLKQEGYEVHTAINTFQRPMSVEDFVNVALEIKPEFVGISMLTFDVIKTYELVGLLKYCGFKVILGGPHPTDCPLEGIHAGADYVVMGEGEETLREIVQGHPCPVGAVTPNSLGIRRRPRLDINQLPLPDLSIFDRELFTDDSGFIKGFHRVYTSRGCPGACTFCDWKVFGQKFKKYDIRQIIGEIERRRDEYGLTSFSIADDCFTVDHDRVLEFCKLIKPLGVTWRANSRANLVTPQMLDAMKDSGCHSIAFGLESGDVETLRRIGKGVNRDENVAAPKMAHAAGLEVYGCLMTGFPWETPQSVMNQIAYVHEIWDDVTLFQVSGSLMPFPGTAIYRQYAEKEGFKEYWLRPEYQKFGIQVYQNAENPYKVSTLYQRLFFDDTYVQNEYFFRYTDEYKAAVRKLVVAIGKHNLRHMFKGQPVRKALVGVAGRASMALHSVFPEAEKMIVGSIMSGRSKIEQVRDKRRGIAKRYTNPN